MTPAATRSPMWGSMLASALLTTVFIFAVFVGGTHPGITETGVRLVSGAIAVIVLVGWLVLALVRPAWRPRSELMAPIAVAFLLYCISSIVSQAPRFSQGAILQGGALVLAFLFLSRLATDGFFRPRLIGVIVGVTVAIAVAYAVQTLFSWGIWFATVGQLTAPPLRPAAGIPSLVIPAAGIILSWLSLGAVNLTAAVCLLALPFAVAVVATRSRGGAVVLAAVGLFVLVTSASRGALLGAAFALLAGLALVALAVLRDPGVGPALRRRLAGRAVVLVVAGVVIAVAVVALLAPTLIGRFAGGIDDARLSLYGATLNLIEANPIFGNGPGTWSLLHSGVTPEGARNIVQYHAHDTYLQTVAEVGLVGAVACLVVAVLAVRLIVIRFLAAAGSERMILGAILVGLAGAAGHAISDHFVNLPGYTLILLALVALGVERAGATGAEVADPAAAAAEGRHGRGPLAVVIGVIVVAVLVLPTILGQAQAEVAAANARSIADKGDWTAAAASLRRAVDQDPDLPLYRMELGLALAHLGDPEARAYVTDAAARDPLPHLQLSVAALALADGDTAAALDAVTRAEERGSDEVVIDLNAGEIARAAGREDLAVRWWARAMAENLTLAGADYFRQSGREELRAAAIDGARALVLTDIDRALLDAYAGAPEASEATLRAMPTSTLRDVALARVLWLEGRRDESIGLLEEAAARDPASPQPPHALVAFCDQLEDVACIERYLPWAFLTGGGADASAANDGSTIPAPEDQRSRGLPDAYPGAVYLQTGLDDMLAPTVVVVGLP